MTSSIDLEKNDARPAKADVHAHLTSSVGGVFGLMTQDKSRNPEATTIFVLQIEEWDEIRPPGEGLLSMKASTEDLQRSSKIYCRMHDCETLRNTPGAA